MKKLNGKSANPSPFEKTCPCTILSPSSPLLKFFRSPLRPSEGCNLLPPFKKERWGEGVRAMIIDKKSSFCLWRQTVTPSFNETITFLWAKSLIWMWRDLVLFLLLNLLFTCMVRLLFDSLFTFLNCANKIGWLQNEFYKCEKS